MEIRAFNPLSTSLSQVPASPVKGNYAIAALALLLLSAAAYLLVKTLQGRVKKVEPPSNVTPPAPSKPLSPPKLSTESFMINGKVYNAGPASLSSERHFTNLLSYSCVVSLLSNEECAQKPLQPHWDSFRGSYGKGKNRNGVTHAAKETDSFSLLIHYPFWPAQQALPDDKHFVALLECARTISRSIAPSIFIQCEDSQGRTATFIALVELFRHPKVHNSPAQLSNFMQTTLAALKGAGHKPTPAQEEYLLSDCLALQIRSIVPD